LWGNKQKGAPYGAIRKTPDHFNSHRSPTPLRGEAVIRPSTRKGIAAAPKQSLVDQLNERLQEKYREYERAALRLELRGEHAAAKVLRQAAGRARLLRNTRAEAGGQV
jgi:hypothetical protein